MRHSSFPKWLYLGVCRLLLSGAWSAVNYEARNVSSPSPTTKCPEMPCSSTCSAEALLVIAGLPTNWLHQHSSNLCLRKFLCTFPPVISSPFSPNGVDRLVILQIPSLYTPFHSLQAVSQVKSLSTAFIDWRKINFVSIWRCSEDERGCGQWIAGSEDGYIMRLT
jgi:hypothetical protein